jgi:TRAP-type C4-dicarboxylate transport system substrate-binding protein
MLSGLDDGGLVALGFSEMGFAYLMSTKPIRTMDDIRNSKSWVPDNDGNALEAVKKFGISPIPLPFGDVLLGLQTGMIETVAASPIAALALQWHTQVKYVVDLPLLYIYGVFALDKTAFNRISQQDQKVVREIMSRAINEIDKQNRLDNQNAFEALVKNNVKVIKPTPETYKEFQRISHNANLGQVSKGNISQSIYQEVSQLVDDYRKQ